MKAIVALLLLFSPAYAQFDQTRWELVKRTTGRFEVLLLKSRTATGSSGLGDRMYDVDVLVRRGRDVVYEYRTPSHGRDSTEPGYYIDDFLELRDVTGDGIPEVLFHSGFQGASDSVAHEHVLRYDPAHRAMTDIADKQFSNSGTHGFRWLTVGNQVFGVVAVRNWPPTVPEEDRCHYCLSPFRYSIYEWNPAQTAFALKRQIDGRHQFEMAGEALDGEWDVIERALRTRPEPKPR
jgi:hypothetical protein